MAYIIASVRIGPEREREREREMLRRGRECCVCANIVMMGWEKEEEEEANKKWPKPLCAFQIGHRMCQDCYWYLKCVVVRRA